MAVSEEFARHHHRRHRDPGIAVRCHRGDVFLRLHLQFGHAAGAAAAGGRGGGRRHRGAGEHLPPPRAPGAGHGAGGGGRQPRGDVCRHCRIVVVGGDFRPGDLRLRNHRPVPAFVRRCRHLRRAGVAVRLSHAHADALFALHACREEARTRVLAAGAPVREAGVVLQAHPGLGDLAPLERAPVRRPDQCRGGAAVPDAANGARAAGRRRPVPGGDPHPARLLHPLHRAEAARGGGNRIPLSGRGDGVRRHRSGFGGPGEPGNADRPHETQIRAAQGRGPDAAGDPAGLAARPHAAHGRARVPARLRPGHGAALGTAAVRRQGPKHAGDGALRHRAAACPAGGPSDRPHGHRSAAQSAAVGA